jgi:hypothetical protein
MNAETAIETAAALLATERHRLTGKELAACEWTQDPEFENDTYVMDWHYPSEPEEPEEPEEDDFDTTAEYERARDRWEDEMADWETDYSRWEDKVEEYNRARAPFEAHLATLERLRNEFYVTITRWIDAQDRAASRRAVETHNRLHPELNLKTQAA